MENKYPKCEGKTYKDYECLEEVAKKNPIKNIQAIFKSIIKGAKERGY